MNRHRHLLLAILLSINSCSRDPFNDDFIFGLTGGYQLIRTSTYMVTIEHSADSRHLSIPAQVVELAWNDGFILGKQQVIRPRGNVPGDTVPVPVVGSFNYWILDLHQTNRFGPMTEVEFVEKLKAIGQTDLNLKNLSQIKRS